MWHGGWVTLPHGAGLESAALLVCHRHISPFEAWASGLSGRPASLTKELLMGRRMAPSVYGPTPLPRLSSSHPQGLLGGCFRV